MEPDHEGREDPSVDQVHAEEPKPAMEPDHEGREDAAWRESTAAGMPTPQWSPTMKVGKTGAGVAGHEKLGGPAMEPDHEGREDRPPDKKPPRRCSPAMEPDHEGREDMTGASDRLIKLDPQWSPTMKVGKT